MKLIARLIFSFFSNLIALIIAGNVIPGFEITSDMTNLMVAAGIFTLINIYLQPLIKMILSPLVILSLGLFTLIINAGMLYLLDILSVNVTIKSPESLLYGTLLITGVNFLLHFSAKFLFKD